MSKQQLNDLDFQNVSRILNLLDPTLAQHAATKNYVDNKRAQFRVTTQLNNTSNTTFINISELSLPVVAGRTYSFEFKLLFQSAATATGLVVSMTSPTGVVSATYEAPNGNDGTAGQLQGQITASGDIVAGTGVQTANTTFHATIGGTFIATVSGNLVPQFRSEINGSQVRIMVGSLAFLEEVIV